LEDNRRFVQQQFEKRQESAKKSASRFSPTKEKSKDYEIDPYLARLNNKRDRSTNNRERKDSNSCTIKGIVNLESKSSKNSARTTKTKTEPVITQDREPQYNICKIEVVNIETPACSNNSDTKTKTNSQVIIDKYENPIYSTRGDLNKNYSDEKYDEI